MTDPVPLIGTAASLARLWAGALALVMLCACGGGSGGEATVVTPPPPPPVTPPPEDPPPEPPPTGGIDRSGISLGLITGFGSVFVNGVEYETDSASIVIDGVAASESDLAVGQLVAVTGTIADDGLTGQATQITFDDDAQGAISAIDLSAGTLEVLGQRIITDASTVFSNDISPPELAGLLVGDVVQISGFADTLGSILATRISRASVGGELEVRGLVSNLDQASMRFNINALVIEFSMAVLEDFDGEPIANGLLVEAKGDALSASGELIATRIERESAFASGGDGELGEIEGLVSRFVSIEDFDLAGIPVRGDASTQFENGTAADLAVGVRLEVEGEFVGGVLVAREISVRVDSDSEVAGFVEAIDTAANSLRVLGITLITSPQTQFEDQLGDSNQPFGLADLDSGDFVEVRGAEASDGGNTVLLSRLERDEPEDELTLEGALDTVDDPLLTVLGVAVETNAQTDFEDAFDNTISASEFFAMAAAGVRVKIRLQDQGGTLLAEEVEFED